MSSQLAEGWTSLVIEDLSVAGMVTNHRLARSVSDAAFGELRRQPQYKTAWYGTELVVADWWFASSRVCSTCGRHDPGLTLRTYRCLACGLVLDRDVNAAINLARWTPVGDLPDLLLA